MADNADALNKLSQDLKDSRKEAAKAPVAEKPGTAKAPVAPAPQK
jgi:hypothetical protein